MAQVATDTQRVMGQVSAMAMLDEEFRARLETSPVDVLREFGMELADSVQVEIVSDPADLDVADDDAGTIHLYVPEAADLSEEELSMVAGAAKSCQSTASTCCTLTCLSSASSSSTHSC